MQNIKPLSWFKYIASNRKKVAALVFTIVSGVFLIMISKMIVLSMEENILQCWTEPMKEISVAAPIKNKLKTESKLKKYDMCMAEIYIDGALGRISTYAFFLDKEGMNFISDQLGIEMIDGVFPQQGTNEILIHTDIARNKNLKIGDCIGKEVNARENLNGKYKVVGIFKSDSVFSLGTLPYYKEQNNISFSGYLYSAQDDIVFLGEEGVDYESYTLEREMEDYENSTQVVKLCLYLLIIFIYMIVSFTILFMVYIFYSQRKKEICILIALGRTKHFLQIRFLKEILAINGIGFLTGVLLATVIGRILNLCIFQELGQELLLWDISYYSLSLVLVVLLTIFALLIVRSFMNKIDYISVIDGEM